MYLSFERNGKREFVQFLSIAKGSVGELRSQLYVVLDQDFISLKTFDRLFALAIETGRIIGGLMNYLRKSEIKENKFKLT